MIKRIEVEKFKVQCFLVQAKLLTFLVISVSVLLLSTPYQLFAADDTGLTQSGKLFQIEIVPGDKNLKVFVVGHKTAEVQFKDLGMVASFQVGAIRKSVAVIKKDKFFVFDRPLDAKDLSLEIKAADNKAETFTVPLR